MILRNKIWQKYWKKTELRKRRAEFTLKILVAGASGVIGRAVVPLLVRERHEVVALSRHLPSRAEQSEPQVRYVAADVFDQGAIFRVFERESPAAVLYLLTDLKEQSSWANARIREVGTRNLFDAAKTAAASKIVAQSIAWAYEPGEEAATESTALDYAATQPRKTTIDGIVALESAVGEIHHHTILRLGTLYGAGTWYDRDGAIAQTVKEGKMAATNAITVTPVNSSQRRRDAKKASNNGMSAFESRRLNWQTGKSLK